ncbi:MAG: DNA phosphorothioation system sulfurtransferase DndC [Blastocatellia bacterium]|nr:DNA phosphorothioation system sulfurtransferase DndC [Blastocatellia bacterium]
MSESFFKHHSIDDLYREIQDVYLRFPQPLVIGYSGGKDSTTVLQATWKALEKLPAADRQKPVFVIASDTKVETPVIVDYINTTLDKINQAAQAAGMPFRAEKVMPMLNDSFWINLIGRGYPAPTTRFRWCTDRMKINPANRFISEKVTQYGEVIMVLGVRKAESSTRAQLMNTYQVKDHILRRHTSLPGAYVYAPIAEFTTDDVWTYLLQVESPWGGNNRDLSALYRNAAGGECPLVIDDTTPTCGNSRFGCWVCTVAERDSSMESLVDNGEEWLEPLLEFRDWLTITTDPARKREFRDIKGRDGRVIIRKNGTVAARTYKLETSKDMLTRLLTIQQKIQAAKPEQHLVLIEAAELHEIRRLWRTERQDWEDSVPAIFRTVTGGDLDWSTNDDGSFDAAQKGLLENICREYDVPFDLVAKLLEVERRHQDLTSRANIQKAIAAVVNQEWRDEAEIVKSAQEFNQLSLFATTNATS